LEHCPVCAGGIGLDVPPCRSAAKEDVMVGLAAQNGDVVSFGPFRLAAGTRLLTRNGIPVELGARALDILVVLSARPNAVVSKKDLLARVWPDVAVEEGSLRFHIANLRKALGDGRDGTRYIVTLPGRGYCFVAPLAPVRDDDAAVPEAAPAFSPANLPNRPIRMIGRSDDIVRLSDRLTATRFVTIVGSGGVGKTTVAAAIGHDLADTFRGAVHFVDLGALDDPGLVTPTVASMLGLQVQSDDAMPGVIAYLRDKRVLLILDTCEHLIDAAAALASRLFAGAPQTHILATSREALRVDGEHVYKLAPLACPPDDPHLTAAVARTFPAAQLFVERAMAGDAGFVLNDADATVVTSICRKLDGVPLAIELAAGRVEGYGLAKTATLLDQRLTLLWPGRRTAPPRQKTLQATLDWSYGLLSGPERAILRRLAVFVGHFTLEAALEVVASPTIDQAQVFGAIDGLIAKSMVAARPAGAMMRYRLLDTTRAYALQGRADDDTALAGLAARHAAYYLRWLEDTGAAWPASSSAAQRSLHLTGLANVRAALERCFGPGGDARTGVRLAAAAAPVFLAMSLLTECHRWSARAIAALDDATRGGREEMHLRAALGVSLMFTRGGQDAARLALDRSFAIAERQGDALDQIQVLGPLQMFHLRTGAFTVALRHSQRCAAIAGALEDSISRALAHSLMGISLHLAGDLDRARAELEAALRSGAQSRWTTTVYLGFDGGILAGAILARTLWLQGYPALAVARARLAVQAAAGTDHPLTHSIALVWAISVFLWAGDLQLADEHVDRLFSCAEPHALRPYLAVGRGFRAELAIRRGDAAAGVASLRACLEELHAAPYELLTTPLTLSLVHGLDATGRAAEALALTNDTIRSVEANGDLCYMPELLRVKGNLLAARPQPSIGDAETCFRHALDIGRRQGARSWELRTAVDLAALLSADGRNADARALLRPVVALFDAGADTPDLNAATRLLATLDKPSARSL
jgi:predicted ATPase/DNA-binding winged helix-turn-helix (wHTH) protein